MAQWSAKNLGETTLEEVREGISYGANSIRDGVSINRVEREKSVVTTSEILRLNDLTCYVRLPGNYPITKLHLPYVRRPAQNIPFEERALNQDSLRDEVLELADKMKRRAAQIISPNTSQFNNNSNEELSINKKGSRKKRREIGAEQIVDERLFD